MNQKKSFLLIPLTAIFLTLWGMLIFSGSATPTVSAAPLLQLTEFPTPTPGPDGRILYIVQPGDTLWRIAAVSGVSLDELRRLNNLTAEDTIQEGRTLLLGFGGPSVAPDATAEPGAIPTIDARDLPPSPTPSPQFGRVCILLFYDANGDTIRQEEEPAIQGGAVSLTERTGLVSQNKEIIDGLLDAIADDPDTLDPRVCFGELVETGDIEYDTNNVLPEGEYNISVAIPEGFNATTKLNETFYLAGSIEVYLDFGAQPSSELLAEDVGVNEGGTLPLYGVFGTLLILAGVGVSIFGRRNIGQNMPGM